MKKHADVLLVNGRVLSGNEFVHKSVAIYAGHICFVGREAVAPSASKIIDLKGQLILPGLIDIHTHLRDLHQAYKEDFYTGTCSALAGGFTTVFDMPIPIRSSESLQQLKNKIEAAEKKAVVNVGFFSGFPSTVREFTAVRKLGVMGFKLYMNRRENLDGGDDYEIRKALTRACDVGLPVAVHAEDLKYIEHSERQFKLSGDSSLRAFLKAHSPNAEALAVQKIVSQAQQIGGRIHFCHLSTIQAVEIVRAAKLAGLYLSCEVTPHHLFLTSKALTTHGHKALMVPPLRGEIHNQALWTALNDGCVDIVASDHAPHSLAEKSSDDIWNVLPGIPGLETTLPVLLDAAYNGRMTYRRLIEVLAEKPAICFGLQSKGFMDVGYDADLVIVDPKRRSKIDPDLFHTKAKYSPFEGLELTGKQSQVFVGGCLAMDEGIILNKPSSSNVLRRKYAESHS